MAAAAALAEVHEVLQRIGFGNQVHHGSICEEAGFESLEDFVVLSKKDIQEMADGYEKHTQAQGCIPFGVMHWVQDQYHCYRITFTGNIADANEFREIIDISIQRAALRKVEDNQVDTISKAADPGKFQDERKWPDWEPAFVKPLSYDWDPYNVCFPSCSYHSSDSTPIKSSYSVLVVDTLLQCTIYDPIMVTLLMSSQVQVAEIAT